MSKELNSEENSVTATTEEQPALAESLDSEAGISPEVAQLLDGASLEEVQEDGASPAAGGENASEEEESTEAASSEAEQTEEKTREDKFSAAFNRLSEREKKVIRREAELKEKVAFLEDVAKASQDFDSNPVRYIRSMLVNFKGTTDEKVIEEAYQDLYNAMTLNVLGADAPEELKQQNSYQKLQHEFDRYKREQQQQALQYKQQALQQAQAAKIAQVKSNIVATISAAKEEYPLLTSQDDYNPGDLVYEIISEDYHRKAQSNQGQATAMSIDEAARKAEEYFQQLAHKWASLTSAAATKNTQLTGSTSKQQAPKARTLTNNKASVTPARSSEDEYIEDDEESKLRVLEMLQIS